MILKRITSYKAGPQWGVYLLVFVGLILAVVALRIFSSFFPASNQLAYLWAVSGEVTVSDGITEIPASSGALPAREARTLLKTGRGFVSLSLMDGSFVIVDSASTIEFNRLDASDSGKLFVFNLVKGRVLVTSPTGSRIPTRLLIGGDVMISLSQGTMGLEVTMDGETRNRVDCLVGQCTVDTIYQISSGQSAQIGPNNTVQVTDDVLYDTWEAMVRASNTTPAILNYFESIFSRITPTIVLPTMTIGAEQVFMITRTNTSTPRPSSTLTKVPTVTPTSTYTKTPWFFFRARTRTPDPERDPFPILTSTPTFNPVLTGTPTPKKTPTPGLTSLPTSTRTPNPSLTSFPTSVSTPNPTLTSFPTSTPIPNPTITSFPTSTTLPNPTATAPPPPTSTPLPSLAPTHTTVPSPTPKPKKNPTPTRTLVPTATNTSVPTPVPSDTPLPTDTPIPATQKPTDTPLPTDTPTPLTNRSRR